MICFGNRHKLMLTNEDSPISLDCLDLHNTFPSSHIYKQTSAYNNTFEFQHRQKSQVSANYHQQQQQQKMHNFMNK